MRSRSPWWLLFFLSAPYSLGIELPKVVYLGSEQCVARFGQDTPGQSKTVTLKKSWEVGRTGNSTGDRETLVKLPNLFRTTAPAGYAALTFGLVLDENYPTVTSLFRTFSGFVFHDVAYWFERDWDGERLRVIFAMPEYYRGTPVPRSLEFEPSGIWDQVARVYSTVQIYSADGILKPLAEEKIGDTVALHVPIPLESFRRNP